MDFGRIAELTLRVQHRHEDGSWGTFEPAPSHHDPAAHDVEREWANGTLYRCTSCADEIVVGNVDDPANPQG
jgi:hypothetical protein